MYGDTAWRTTMSMLLQKCCLRSSTDAYEIFHRRLSMNLKGCISPINLNTNFVDIVF